MPIREFLRGGYQKIKEPTVVSSHGHPIFTVMPGIAMRTKKLTEPNAAEQKGLPPDDHR